MTSTFQNKSFVVNCYFSGSSNNIEKLLMFGLVIRMETCREKAYFVRVLCFLACCFTFWSNIYLTTRKCGDVECKRMMNWLSNIFPFIRCTCQVRRILIFWFRSESVPLQHTWILHNIYTKRYKLMTKNEGGRIERESKGELCNLH